MTYANPIWKIIAVRTLQVSAVSLAAHGLFHWPLTGPHALGLWVTPGLCLYFVFVFVAPCTWSLPIQTRLPGTANAVALTFDDGPSAECTPRILDVLAAFGAQATFFVLGENVRRHPEVLRRIVREGHTIGIHADRHEPFVLKSAARVGEEIRRTREAVRQACPEAAPVTWLRPPNGFKTLILPWIARRAGCRLVAWSVNARDYRAPNAAAIAAAVLTQARPGAIILLHDGAGNALTADALPALLSGLAERSCNCTAL